MNKKIAYFLTFCMVSMGLLVMVPSVSADVSVETTDADGVPDIHFRQGDYIYYQIAMGSEYAGEQVKITITDELGTQVHTNFEYLDSFAEYKSWNPTWPQGSDWYYIDGSEEEGPNWNISVFNASSLELLTWHIFEVYVPSVWTATIELFEDSSHTIPTSTYSTDARVYFTVHIEDEHGAPLQYSSAYAYVEYDSSEDYVEYIYTNDEGDDTGYFDVDDYGYDPGSYILKIEYPSGTEIQNTKLFTVYEPIYTATLETYTDYFHNTQTSIYQINDYVYWSVHIEDQYGRNLTDTYIYLEVEHGTEDPQRIPWWSTYWVNDYGNASDNFWLGSYWDDDEQMGLYTIEVFEEYADEPFEGGGDFEVISIKITPDREPENKYAQGEEITITITTEIYDEDIDITLYNDDWEEIESWEDQSLSNKMWKMMYTLPGTLADGYYILAMNESDTDRSLGTLGINVQKFTLKIWSDAGAYLPGETMIVYYTVTSNKDGGGVSGTTIEWEFYYYDTEDFEWDSFSGDPFTAGASGTFPVNIPESAEKDDADLYVWANDTDDHTDDKHLDVDLGGISAYLDMDGDEFLAGDFFSVYVYASIDGMAPLEDGNVDLKVIKDDVEIDAYTKTGLKTDKQGRLTYLLVLQDNAATGQYTIEINVSKENEWDTDHDTFEVVEAKMYVELEFEGKYYTYYEEPKYYSGDTVTVKYILLEGNEIVEGVNCEYWVYSGDSYIDVGISSTGEFEFTAPPDFEGSLDISVVVTAPDGSKIHQYAEIDVDRAGLLLYPESRYYKPGSTIKVKYSVVGNALEDTQYYYEIEDDNHYVVKREGLTSSSGEFEFKVPDENVPDWYEIIGYVTDSNGVIIADKDEVMVYRETGYMITFTLDKNTYRPGEKATLHYKVTSLDGSDIPEEFGLIYGIIGGPSNYIETSKAEGDLKVKIPKDASDGTGYFYISSEDLSTDDINFAQAQQEADIRKNPNPFAETIGDMSLLELILLVLLIITLIIALVAWKRGKMAMEEAKLPPWKKESSLPEPDKFKEPEEGEPSIEEPPMDEDIPPPPGDVEPPPGEM